MEWRVEGMCCDAGMLAGMGLQPHCSVARSPDVPRSLTAAEVQHHITTPIRRKNRAHAPVRYSELVNPVRERTGKKVSSRTVRRYGKEEAKGKMKRGKKRTADERQ